jgi:hypothetical protein
MARSPGHDVEYVWAEHQPEMPLTVWIGLFHRNITMIASFFLNFYAISLLLQPGRRVACRAPEMQTTAVMHSRSLRENIRKKELHALP